MDTIGRRVLITVAQVLKNKPLSIRIRKSVETIRRTKTARWPPHGLKQKRAGRPV